jgi:ubiquitin-protein ligase
VSINEKQNDKTSDMITEFNLVKNFIHFYDRISKFETVDNFRKESMPESLEGLTTKEIYKLKLKDEVFKEYSGIDVDNFKKLISESGEKIETNFAKRSAISHMIKENFAMKDSLPVEFESSIFYRFNENNMKLREFIITGPQGTPYDSGMFHFRLLCTSRYPDTNPLVNIYTTGGGSVRFNPNLYNCGKVCLSLLGTWSGTKDEGWIPGVSTILQIMVSIQSMVMIEHPYFNEPGYESEINTERGKLRSKDYNDPVRLNCMKYAMIEHIRNPVPGFEEATRLHFKIKSEYIKTNCKKWVDESPTNMKSDFENTYNKLCQELDKLCSIPSPQMERSME